MLDYQGKLLFPNDVEVLEIIPQHQYVYPIFKNGSTSLRKSSYLAVSNQELKNLTNIEVFVRNPHNRFLSGVQTYIRNLGPKYDSQTVLNLVSQNLYLNREDYVRDVVNKSIMDLEYNDLLAELADQDIYLDLDEFADWIEDHNNKPSHFIQESNKRIT